MLPIRVLVVDDVREVRELYQRMLVREGMDVHTAENGLRALDVIRRERPAVVVTDIDMPEMDGLELCRTIRADPGLSAIPIVVLSGGDHGPAVEEHCHSVLAKPCPAALLLETVLRAVGDDGAKGQRAQGRDQRQRTEEKGQVKRKRPEG